MTGCIASLVRGEGAAGRPPAPGTLGRRADRGCAGARFGGTCAMRWPSGIPQRGATTSRATPPPLIFALKSGLHRSPQ